MGGVWLHDLPDWLAKTGIPVDVWPGWELRSRRSGGYDAVLGVCAHHTGSTGKNPDGDMRYMWDDASIRPVGAIYIAQDGWVTVGAAGATNVQGRGGPVQCSRGVVPVDQGNRYLVGIEAGGGRGEPWPDEQMEAYREVIGVLCDRLVLVPDQDVWTHHSYAPDRKPDPAGPTPLRPSMGGDSKPGRTWPVDELRRFVMDRPTDPDEYPPDPADPTLPRPTLRRGSRGPQVSILIDLLKLSGWYPPEHHGDHNDGVFGQRTEHGVLAMQSALGVTQDGVYGPVTYGALQADLAGDRPGPPTVCVLPDPVRPGTTNSVVVRDLQTLLVAGGWYPIGWVDGDYGPVTKQGVQKLQRHVRDAGAAPGPIDGWYGRMTRTAACQAL